MITTVNSSQLSLIPYHDADMISIKTIWASDNAISMIVRLQISQEEDASVLLSLGIASSSIDIIFDYVYRSMTDVKGMYYPREVLLDWDTRTESDLIGETRRVYLVTDTIYHHTLAGSAGSTMDILCKSVLIASVESP